jgi:hypothetical protein
MKTASTLFLSLALATFCARAEVLFQDSLNYNYTDGSIEGQGQWYCYYPSTPHQNAFVTNNVLLLTYNPTNDSVAAPTNGFTPPNPGSITYASFSINVSQLPTSPNGGYFCQFQNNNDTNDVCHVFISTRDAVTPGSYRLGIANSDTSFLSVSPPVNFPMDLAPGVTYNVVIVYDTDQGSPTVGATLMINPSYLDYQNFIYDADNQTSLYYGQSYVFPEDLVASSAMNIVISQIGFSPYVNAGISNVICGTTFTDVNTTNVPVIGIQPQSGTNYSGNSTTLFVAASGSDLTYQWYSTTYGALSDSANFTGSTSNILTVNNLSASDSYHVVVTDAYGNTVTSSTAAETVITTATAPFFTDAPLNLTNNLFNSFGLTNLAVGTGPLTYQWYFAPTNTPTTFAPVSGQTATNLTIPELEYPNAGNYYVLATGPHGVTAGPTNSLTVVAPLIATLPQLHTLMGLVVTNITPSSVVPISTNNVAVSGYVSVFGPLTATTRTYAEFYMTYSNYGIYVFFSPSGHTNQIPVPGSFVTVNGTCQVYKGQLEIDPNSASTANALVISNALPIQMPAPQLCNASNFNVLTTNSLTPYGVQVQCSLVTFTNVYIYANRTGGAITFNGGKFPTNSTTTLYMTEGPYSAPNNTNSIEIYVPAYTGNDANGYGYQSTNLWGATIPTYCYQITGILEYYNGIPGSELAVTRLQDFVTTAPASFTAGLTKTNVTGGSAVSWPAQVGSTYSVYSASNLNGPWSQTFGLSYYPSTGVFTDTNKAAAKFYKVSTP